MFTKTKKINVRTGNYFNLFVYRNQAKMSELGIGPSSGLYNGHPKISSRTNGLAQCQCCPYGYHIDLGFVEFCARMEKENRKPSPSKKERRERRRQTQSMEVLLGLANPKFWNIQQLLPAVSICKWTFPLVSIK